MHWLENEYQASAIGIFIFIFIDVIYVDCQHVCSIWLCRLGACACWSLMVDLHITGRLLIGMGKQLKAL